jgi:hypothetical protein
MPAPARPRTATYTPTIVWSTGTLVDTSAYDDVSRRYLNRQGLSVGGLGRDQVRAYAPPAAPSFDLALTNESGDYSPGGPLGLFLGRGLDTTLTARWGVDVPVNDPNTPVNSPDVLVDGYGERRLFTGKTDTMDQSISRGNRVVSVRAIGTLSLLNRAKPVTTLYESIRTDEAITVILDAVGWPEDRRVIDTGDTTLLYWWLDGQTTAMAALNAILDAEGAGGCAYEDGEGTFHFEGRQYRSNATRSLETQYSFFDGPRNQTARVNDPDVLVNDPNTLANGTGQVLYHVIPTEYRSNPDEVVQNVRATVNVRTATSTQKIWEYGTTLTLTGNEVRDLKVTASDPFKSAVTPVAATDYTVSAGSLSSVELLSTSGQQATLRLTAGVGGATVIGVTSNGIQLRAVSLPVTSQVTVDSTIDTTASAARTSGEDPYTVPLWPEITPNQALDLVNSLALRYQRERRQIVFRVVNINAAHMEAILNMRISDRVRFIHAHAGIQDPYWVEQISHEIGPGGGLHTMTVGCERVFELIGSEYDDASVSEGYDLSIYGL